MGKLRILFITPAATRSGAPMLMLHLLRHLKGLGGFDMSIVLVSDGPMNAELTDGLRAQTFYRYRPSPSLAGRSLRVLRRIPVVARWLRWSNAARCRTVVNRWPPDLVYCNSIAAAPVLDAMGPYRCPVAMNIHELEYVLRTLRWPGGDDVERTAHHVTHYIAGSEAVRANLVARHQVPAARVSVVHDFIATHAFDSPAGGEPRAGDAALPDRLGVPRGASVVGAIAVVEWRKGADLFVPLARLLPHADASGRPIHLVWVGGGDEQEVAKLKSDVETAGLGHRVHVAGPTARTADWYPSFSAFALLSREDPFPLVALEAAACGVPTVCFAGAGGMPEFVEEDAGIVVPYLDLAAFAGALSRLVDDPALREQLGRTAAAKVRARHDVSVAVPQIVSTIQRLAAGPRP